MFLDVSGSPNFHRKKKKFLDVSGYSASQQVVAVGSLKSYQNIKFSWIRQRRYMGTLKGTTQRQEAVRPPPRGQSPGRRRLAG